ncbi:MAG: hypothetical protein EOO48_04820 [Flavobacterium sp.]|nr:MAG: hypothetical protein EOO48_04820 [Flavobacterium sp.]
MEIQNENIKSLILDIRERIGRPVSNRVVVATIESLGIRNKDTESDFGIPSIYELADLVYYELTTAEEHIGAKNLKEKEAIATGPKVIQMSDYFWVKTKIFLTYYPKGILHLLPILLQIAAIVVFGYSLWTYVGFNQVQSTAVVLGVMIGLISTGGFVQVIGKQASFYWNHEDYVMVKETVNYLLKAGSVSIGLVLAAIFVCNFFFHIYPYEVLLVVFVYAFLIGLLLLLLAPLHTVQQRWVISLAMITGTAVAIILKQETILLTYCTHWIGIATAVIIARVFLVIFFRKKIRKKKVNSALRVKSAIILYHNYKYFLYGIFVYVFIFTDRMMAWSCPQGEGQLPFVVFFEKNYELGMDMAILVFLLLAGVLEFSIASFTRFLDIGQKITAYNNPAFFNKQLKKMYWQHIGFLFLTSAAIAVLIYFIMYASWGYSGQFNEELRSVSIKVCVLGGIGYMLLAWGMLNTLYLFTLGQPSKPLKAIITSCLVNVIAGFILSRFISYEYAVLGMVAGAGTFMIMTLRANMKFFNNLDYHYYAAY